MGITVDVNAVYLQAVAEPASMPANNQFPKRNRPSSSSMAQRAAKVAAKR
jgi:hypothetical protein